ncbi:hypothetical protein FACS189451_07200 [Bacteroidia bacterium]|nr:hypothetical protein FACS189451_07200 [Bacteroidia bacterium]
MKKISIALFMVVALTVSLSTYAQDSKKEATPKAKTEQVEKKKAACCEEKKHDSNAKSSEGKACCAEKKDKADCEKAKAKSADNKEAATETKSCGKKK